MALYIKLDEDKIRAKVINDDLGLFISNEWKRLINPYTPRDTGTMQDTATIAPWKIHYIQKYSEKVYYGYDLNFQHKNPYSTYEWDIAAENAGQKDKLYRTINNHLNSGL
jgi:hypothetical protein